MSTTMEVVVCGACGAKNRVSLERVRGGLDAVCGRCHAPLQVGGTEGRGEPAEVTDATFAAEVLQSPVPVLVDLWAPWCGPCRMVAPVLDRLAADWGGRVKVAKVNVDECPRTASQFNVGSIPTLLVIHGGREVDRMVGVMPAQEIRRRVEAAVG
jgi:thioredoxin 2